MKLATYKDGTIDGALVVVSKDHRFAVSASNIAPDLLAALRDWEKAAPKLDALYAALNASEAPSSFAFDPAACAAPLPISPQWCDASAFLNHGTLMDKAFNLPPQADKETIPLVYQGASDDFLGCMDEVIMPSEADGIDFEGEFGVIVGPVAMASTPLEAQKTIRLLVQINDWSLRALGPREMKAGFGFLQAKPSTAFAPIAVTPDELGNAWADGRVHLNLNVDFNGNRFGQANGREMHFSFGDLIAHVARTRKLTAGTIIGSGTVSNADRAAGFSCIAERRVIEMIDKGNAETNYMHFGDRVRMEARWPDGTPGPFGVINQTVKQLREKA